MSALDLDAAIGKLVVSAPGRDGNALTLNIGTVANYPGNVEAPICPILFPHPDNWLGETSSTPGVWDGSEFSEKNNVFNLIYLFLYAQIGEDRGLYVFYEPATLMLEALRQAIMAIDVHMIGGISVATSALKKRNESLSGKNFIGCQITVKATEKSES